MPQGMFWFPLVAFAVTVVLIVVVRRNTQAKK
jgi:hypothetical protein